MINLLAGLLSKVVGKKPTSDATSNGGAYDRSDRIPEPIERRLHSVEDDLSSLRKQLRDKDIIKGDIMHHFHR